MQKKHYFFIFIFIIVSQENCAMLMQKKKYYQKRQDETNTSVENQKAQLFHNEPNQFQPKNVADKTIEKTPKNQQSFLSILEAILKTFFDLSEYYIITPKSMLLQKATVKFTDSQHREIYIHYEDPGKSSLINLNQLPDIIKLAIHLANRKSYIQSTATDLPWDCVCSFMTSVLFYISGTMHIPGPQRLSMSIRNVTQAAGVLFLVNSIAKNKLVRIAFEPFVALFLITFGRVQDLYSISSPPLHYQYISKNICFFTFFWFLIRVLARQCIKNKRLLKNCDLCSKEITEMIYIPQNNESYIPSINIFSTLICSQCCKDKNTTLDDKIFAAFFRHNKGYIEPLAHK